MNQSKKEVYEVQGMTCSGCERSVQKVVSNIAGVSSAQASLQAGALTVEYDPTKVDIETIRNSVAKIGYKVGAKI